MRQKLNNVVEVGSNGIQRLRVLEFLVRVNHRPEVTKGVSYDLQLGEPGQQVEMFVLIYQRLCCHQG